MSEKSPKIFVILGLMFALSLLAISTASACGSETKCMIGDDRHYYIKMPKGHDGVSRIGAIFFMHGYRGTAAGIMRNQSLEKAVSDLGLALVAPKSAYEDWAIPGTPSGKAPVELEYFDAIVADIKKRFPIDTSRLMASGFSAGGMMTWNLACDRAEMFAAFAPIAGTFWEPTPTSCSSPVTSIIHTHGTSDKIVPLAGRPIADTKQGDVSVVLDMYARKGRFSEKRTYDKPELEFQCNEFENSDKQILEICLHPGGHSMKAAYVTNAWNKFVKQGIIK